MVEGTSEYRAIARQFAATKEAENFKKGASSSEGTRVSDERNRAAAIKFKSLHLLVVVFFLWILSLHATGIYLFTKGFLLTRLVLEDKSECQHPPINAGHKGSYVDGCWHPKQFQKAVVIIIDALRYDFVVPHHGTPQHFHNTFTVLYETAVLSPERAFLLPFIADPPTSTLQRLKALTTGTLPTFMDLGSNFAGTAIEEDNLLAQLRDANRTLVHLGDDTWHSLFPGYFEPNLTHSYDSFNVWDLHTVDDGITKHLLPLLSSEYVNQWDVIFGHYLGVDHAGHRYGPDHPAMTGKLRQMDDVLRKFIEALDDETLLVVMGDHGMDVKGDHGGESDDEVEAALWMYSKKGMFGRSKAEFLLPPATAKERPVWQIDLVPTLSLLLGVPVPFNNLGSPIVEAFIGATGKQWQNLARVNALTSAQIHKYQQQYAKARGLEEDPKLSKEELWNKSLNSWMKLRWGKKKVDANLPQSIALEFSDYQRETLRVCKALWASFDIPNMLQGIAILALSVAALVSFARSTAVDGVGSVPGLVRNIGLGGLLGALLGWMTSFAMLQRSIFDLCLLGSSLGGLVGYGIASYGEYAGFMMPLPRSLWGWLALIFTLSQSIGFASNSYTIWEDEISLFFLSLFAAFAAISSIRRAQLLERVLGTYHSVFFLLLTRTASLSRLCREEQMPYCRSTYYASATSSTSATWHLFIPYFLAIVLPLVIRSYYVSTRSYEGSAIFWIGSVLRMGLFGTALYWTLEAADDGNWFAIDTSTLTAMRVMIAQIVLGVAFATGTTTYVWAAPCVRIDAAITTARNSIRGTVSKPRSTTILGYANVHGTRYFLLVSSWLLVVILVQKPIGGGVIAILACQILSLLEILDSNNMQNSAIGPILLSLLGTFYFFKTGHQATLASIQWNSAFIALKTIRYPWSPILVVMNTFGAQILTAVAVPLVALWKQPPRNPGLLGDMVKAMATHLSYYAVVNLATTMWAGWLRRHLMLYRIFSPRFMTGAAVLLLVDLVGALVAVGGYRWNILAINEVFGWG